MLGTVARTELAEEPTPLRSGLPSHSQALWGRDAALKRFEENYRGTWRLEPKFDEVQVTEIAPGVVRVFAPSVFTIAPAGQDPQPRRFLLTQVYVKTAEGWRLSTLLPFPTP
jgi:hypothetical protein